MTNKTDSQSQRGPVNEVRLHLWQGVVSSWKLQATVPVHLRPETTAPMMVLTLLDNVYVLWGRAGHHDNEAARNADAFVNTRSVFDINRTIQGGFVHICLDRVLQYSLRRNEWSMVYPASESTVTTLKFHPLSTYPLVVVCSDRLHLITPKEHIAFCPVENRWAVLPYVRLPKSVEIVDDDGIYCSEPFVHSAIECNGKIFALILERWFTEAVSWELFVCAKGMYYTLYDPASDTWSDLEAIRCESDNQDLHFHDDFLLSSRGTTVSVTRAGGDGSVVRRKDVFNIDISEHKITQSGSAVPYKDKEVVFPFTSNDSIVDVGGTIYGCPKVMTTTGDRSKKDGDVTAETAKETSKTTGVEPGHNPWSYDRKADEQVVLPDIKTTESSEDIEEDTLHSNKPAGAYRRMALKLSVPYGHG
ncbi:uncharacterized protein [Ptychodera flava]|uniref:uncharacterized protein n=1 Tax=Ptychodera flava TaxID=63121 RepID=UPI00396A6651